MEQANMKSCKKNRCSGLLKLFVSEFFIYILIWIQFKCAGYMDQANMKSSNKIYAPVFFIGHLPYKNPQLVGNVVELV